MKADKLIVSFLLLCFALSAQAHASNGIDVLHTFSGGNDGSYPYAGLVSDAAGNIYGTTQIGGAYGAGTVFKLSPSSNGKWEFSVLYTFTGGVDGGNPLGSLVFDPAGHAYSTVSSGGANGLGGVFELAPPAQNDAGKAWREKVLYSFEGGSDGAIPFGNVLFDAAGNLWGTTSIGGTAHIGCPPIKGCGTIYALTPTGDGGWKERIVHRFSDAFKDGSIPRAGLVADAAGNLYGTTYEGGDTLACNGDGCGMVYELEFASTNHYTYKKLVDFNVNNGAYAQGPLFIGPNGILFGTTLYGGLDNAGTIFSLTPASGGWTFQTIYSFNVFDGLQPCGNLALDASGNIYGATYEGGTNDWGAIFQLVPGASGWTENLLYSALVGGTDFGANPLGGVMLDAANNLYMTGNQGGNLNDCQPNSGCGTVTQFNLSGTH
jgi:uncharacterized repeat protein (TIGR03803 family)